MIHRNDDPPAEFVGPLVEPLEEVEHCVEVANQIRRHHRKRFSQYLGDPVPDPPTEKENYTAMVQQAEAAFSLAAAAWKLCDTAETLERSVDRMGQTLEKIHRQGLLFQAATKEEG